MLYIGTNMKQRYSVQEFYNTLAKNNIIEINGYIVDDILNKYEMLTKKRFLTLYINRVR